MNILGFIGIMLSVVDNVHVDSKTFVATSSISRIYRALICVRVFIKVSVCCECLIIMCN